MPRKRKKKARYDPVESLRPTTLRPELEPMSRNLYELACCGSKAMWDEIGAPDNLKENEELRHRFLASSHEGMADAQRIIVEHLSSGDDITDSHEVLFRGICDAIAWQLLGDQLCYARRLYKGHRQPDIKNSNFESVVFASSNYMENNPGSIALISDLTSFVQIGDLLTLDGTGKFGIVEVKEGEKNRIIGDFMKNHLNTGCDMALYQFARQEGVESLKQMGRMLRQAQRMSHVSEVMSKGESTDPDSDEKIMIPDDLFIIDSWEGELVSAVEEADIKGWSIRVIDDCVFLGCYSDHPMKAAGHIIFNGWFDNCGGTPECPRATLLDAMSHPLAVPVFNLNIPNETKFDILFGRKQVCIGFNVESFLEKCRKEGLLVRVATNKETSRADQTGNRPYRHNGKAIFIGDGKTELMLMDGIFLRAIHHMQSPIKLTKTMLQNISKESPNKEIHQMPDGTGDL